MAKQDRAIRTRRVILEAAAQVFEEQGYQATTISEILQRAGVTKGALYFHFESKKELAQGVLEAQDLDFVLPPQDIRLQELVDVGAVHAYRLQTNPLVQAGVRLSLDQQAHGFDRSGPFLRWRDTIMELLVAAKKQNELLPHVEPLPTADVYVGAFAGIQSMSHALTGYQDLRSRLALLQRHLLPSIAVPSVLAALDLSPERGKRLAELAASAESDADQEPAKAFQ